MCQTSYIAVHAMLVREGRVLLSLRADTASAPGLYHLPGGKLEDNESLFDAIIRESKEELGIDICAQDLTCSHISHNRYERYASVLHVFFRADHWSGEPVNCEPSECAGIDWFPLESLPENMIPAFALALHSIRTGLICSAGGWDDSAEAFYASRQSLRDGSGETRNDSRMETGSVSRPPARRDIDLYTANNEKRSLT